MNKLILVPSTLVLLFCFSSIVGQSPRTGTRPAGTAALGRLVGIGEYSGVGPSSNRSLDGQVKIVFSKFDRRTSDAEGVLEALDSRCENSELSGLIDSGGVTLNGSLECASVARNILVRCSFSGSSSLVCNYTLRSNSSSRIEERGSFTLSKVLVATTRTAVTQVYSAPSPPKRRKYSVQFPAQAFDVDLALVNRDDVYLKSSAYPGGNSLQKISPGDMFAIIDRTPVNGMLKVVSFSTGAEGWIPADDVETKYTTSAGQESLLDRTPGRSDRDPTVTIKNDTERTLTFGLGSQTYTIGPYQSLRLDIKPGTYKYYVASPKVVPIIGQDYLDSGFEYNWTFYIRTQ